MESKLPILRIHRSWLTDLEKKLLIGIAGRLPASITSDHLTLLGVLGALLCGLSYWATLIAPAFLALACLGIVLNWFGDSLDGTVARLRKRERPIYGFFIDHTTDVASQLFIFLGLGLSHYMRFETACMMLLSYWLAALYTFIRAIATREFQISYYGIGPTEIRLGLLLYNLGIVIFGPMQAVTRYGTFSLMDGIAVCIFFVVTGSFFLMVWQEGRRLAELDALASRPAVWTEDLAKEPEIA